MAPPLKAAETPPLEAGAAPPQAAHVQSVMSRDDEGVGVHSSNDGTRDEEYYDKVQELLTVEEMEVIYKYYSAEAEAEAEANKLKLVTFKKFE